NHFRLDTSAHNSYTVNDKGYSLGGDPSRVGLSAGHSERGWAYIHGYNGLYQDCGPLNRSIIFLREVGAVLVIDWADSLEGKETKWCSYFHFAPDLNVQASNERIKGICEESGLELSLVPSDPCIE